MFERGGCASAEWELRVPEDDLVEADAHGLRGVAAEMLVGEEEHALSALESPAQDRSGVRGGADDASVLAAERRDLAQVAITMVFFGAGTALPLLFVGALSRKALLRWRGQMARVGGALKFAFGLALVFTAGGILLGLDRTIETALVTASPEWLTNLTTNF